eukprot:3033159-Rhodomonas_salina.11
MRFWYKLYGDARASHLISAPHPSAKSSAFPVQSVRGLRLVAFDSGRSIPVQKRRRAARGSGPAPLPGSSIGQVSTGYRVARA